MYKYNRYLNLIDPSHHILETTIRSQGRIQDFKLGGGADLTKLRRAEGVAKIVGVFHVKNHDCTPKNHIFSNFRGGGGGAPRRPPPPPPLDPLLGLIFRHQ